MSTIRDLLHRIRSNRRSDERGASLVEYALMVGLIAVVCVGAVGYLGEGVGSTMEDTTSSISDAGEDDGPTTTTTPPAGCASLHADGYATGAGYGWDCYSPTRGAYNL